MDNDNGGFNRQYMMYNAGLNSKNSILTVTKGR